MAVLGKESSKRLLDAAGTDDSNRFHGVNHRFGSSFADVGPRQETSWFAPHPFRPPNPRSCDATEARHHYERGSGQTFHLGLWRWLKTGLVTRIRFYLSSESTHPVSLGDHPNVFASAEVLLPRSFSLTTSFSVMMNVITPDDRYSAGYATKRNPPAVLPSVRRFATTRK